MVTRLQGNRRTLNQGPEKNWYPLQQGCQWPTATDSWRSRASARPKNQEMVHARHHRGNRKPPRLPRKNTRWTTVPSKQKADKTSPSHARARSSSSAATGRNITATGCKREIQPSSSSTDRATSWVNKTGHRAEGGRRPTLPPPLLPVTRRSSRERAPSSLYPASDWTQWKEREKKTKRKLIFLLSCSHISQTKN